VTFHCGIVGSGLRNLAKTCSRRLLGPILHNVNQNDFRVFKTTLQILDAVIVGRISLYFIAHALKLFFVFRYDIAELYWFCMDFYCAVLWMFVIMKWRPSRSEEHLHVSNYFLEYCDGILPTARPVWTPEQASCFSIISYRRSLPIRRSLLADCIPLPPGSRDDIPLTLMPFSYRRNMIGSFSLVHFKIILA
jgi:hypothetical protein